MKTCTTCKIEKSLDLFTKSNQRASGIISRCKDCTKKYKQDHTKKNKESIKEKKRLYHIKNLEKIKETKRKYYQDNKEYTIIKSTNWIKNNREKRNDYFSKYVVNKRKEDSVFNLIEKVRNRTKAILRKKNFKKNKSFKDYIGCTVEQLTKHLESKFTDGMSWELVRCGEIHIDHIKPLHLAKTEQEVYELNHYTNLQPLWALDNLKKGGKYE